MIHVTTHSVFVDYHQTVEEMIEAGKYDYCTPAITSENFPVTLRESGEIEIQLIFFNRFIKSEEVLRELNRMGLRPAEPSEFLSLGAKYPEIQREFIIVAPGLVWLDSEGGRNVLCLSDDEIYLLGFELEWGPGCCFPAVCINENLWKSWASRVQHTAPIVSDDTVYLRQRTP